MSDPTQTSSSADQAAVAPGGSQFPTTQWSMVLRASDDNNTQTHSALESLCRDYWYPLYAFVRRQGRTHHEAEDGTQEFFARLLSGDGLQRARPERGRFRTFLLTGMKNFLTSEWRRTQAARRGSGVALLSLDFAGADETFSHDAMDPALTPEQAFDRNWTLQLLDRTVRELRGEYTRSGRGAVFDALAPFVWGNASQESLAQRAGQLGMSVQAFTVALHRARRRLGERLRDAVAETVAEPSEIDAELRHLVNTVGAQTSAT